MRRTIICILWVWTLCIVCAAQEATSDAADLAKHFVAMADTPRGVCAVLGCGDGSLATELARCSELTVHSIDPCGYAVADARTLAEPLLSKRLVIEQGALDPLPYGDNMLDLVVAVDLSDEALDGLRLAEILRVLQPRGAAIVGAWKQNKQMDLTPSAKALKAWLKTVGGDIGKIHKDDLGVWAVVTKPVPEGVDDWTHWEHGPDNNPVSTDQVIKAPYMTQWLGLPYYIAMPAVTTTAAGRVFTAMGHIAHHEREEAWLNCIHARNGYNGQELWRRRLPDGYLVHRSAFVATPDTFYMIDLDGNGCLLVDPATGEELDEIRIRGLTGEWKWIAIEDGVLYALAGEDKDPPETTVVRSPYSHWSWGELSPGYYQGRVPWGFGTALVAYDLAKRDLMWRRDEEALIDSRAMAVGGGNVFLYCPDSKVACLDADSGEEVWANGDAEVRKLIEEPGRGLGSTPGFRTTCFAVYTPEVLFFEAQTRNNVVALAMDDGHMLWHHTKTTNNPNMIFADGDLIVGIGDNGWTLRVNPLTGEIIEDLGFGKRSCARLTATPDSFFCRGWPEGITRYDRAVKKVLFNGAMRPSCNDGIIGANGLLYAGPWLCDCNLSLMGMAAMCSAGGYDLAPDLPPEQRLEVAESNPSSLAPFDVTPEDWETYRGDNAHSGASAVPAPATATRVWHYQPPATMTPTVPTAAGGLVFVCGDDGVVRALDACSGALVWSYRTAAPILRPPTLCDGRAYVGSGDGHIYALEAATGRLLWRFRAAPRERRIMVYGALCSTWPVNTGVLVDDGVAYAAAGIIDYDGTYVYALDAATGEVKWQNTTSGHLDEELRKGISAQGGLVAANGRLWMASGNVISPASYDLATGAYVGPLVVDGSPRANRGEELGLFADRFLVLGGRLQYSATESVVNPGSFEMRTLKGNQLLGNPMTFQWGRIAPAWNDQYVVAVRGRRAPVVCYAAEAFAKALDTGDAQQAPRPRWAAQLPPNSDVVSLALTPNAVLAVHESPRGRALATAWTVAAFHPETGAPLWRHGLPSAALPGGLLVDRDGRVVVTLQNGDLICLGNDDAMRAYINNVTESAKGDPQKTPDALAKLTQALQQTHQREPRNFIIDRIEELGGEFNKRAKQQGCVIAWKLLGPTPWDIMKAPVDTVQVGEPDVDVTATCKVGDRILQWTEYRTEHPAGLVDLARVYGTGEWLAMYAYAEVELPQAGDLLLKVGSNDGFKCWFNGEEVGRFDGGRTWGPDQDALRVSAKPGTNAILLKITQHGGAWGFSARLTKPDDSPINLSGK